MIDHFIAAGARRISASRAGASHEPYLPGATATSASHNTPDSTVARHARAALLFDQALALPRARRHAFLMAECGEDAVLRDDVISLLDAHDSAGDYFDDLSEHVIDPVLSALAATPTSETVEAFQTKFGNTYHVERELGGGGMSRVFLADDLRLRRRVVIKVLPPEMIAPNNADRFQREIELAARLQHPHIVPLLTADKADGTWYYTMPFVTGETLRARIARAGSLPLEAAADIWRDVLDALAYAHANGVMHRDIKPTNILLSGRNALVTDFGIARAIETAAGDAWATNAGLAIGTPAYMAPEQAEGARDVDERIDIYAAGLLMYEMLAGFPPFRGSSTRELLHAHLTREPPPLTRTDVPQHLLHLVMRCLAKDPAARPASAEAVLAEIDSGATTPLPAPRSRTRRALVYAVAALLLTAIVISVVDRPGGPGPTAAASPPVIAVLPMANLAANPDDAALANGMTQELTSVLGKNDNLRVIPSTSVASLEGRRMDVRQIANALHASYLLEGNLQKDGSRIRMQVRLVDALDGRTRWSETYDRAFADVFDVQEEIARSVATELAVRLTPNNVDRRHTPRIASYEWYLRGMDLSLLRSRAGQRQGVEFFERAIALDSTYAAAHAGLVRMYLSLWNAAPARERPELLERARAAALKAVALDDSNALAVASLAWYQLAARELDAAEATFKRAIALDSRVPRGHEGLARLYMLQRRPAEQLAAAQLSLERDPLSHSAIREHSLALATNGRCEDSLEPLNAIKALSPPAAVGGVLRGQCYASREQWPEAITEFRWAAAGSATFALAFLGYSLGRAGHRDEAKAILSDLVSGRKDSHGNFGIAIVYAGLRNFDLAFAKLDDAIDDNSVNAYIMHPMFVDLHRDPRFERIELRLRGHVR